MCLRVHNACGGLYNTARRRNPSLRSHRFWRNPHIFRFSHRHRLQISLQRIIRVLLKSRYICRVSQPSTLYTFILYTNNYVSQVNTKPTSRLSHHRSPLYQRPLLLWHPRTRRLRNITILLSYSCHYVTKIQTTASSHPKRPSTLRHSYPPWHPSRTLYWLHPRTC